MPRIGFSSAPGAKKLSDLQIDAAKDWQNKGITNFAALQVADKGGLRLYQGLPANLSHSGISFYAVIGENIDFGQAAYRKNDGKIWLAKADASATMPAYAIAIQSAPADGAAAFITHGFVRFDTWNFTPGAPVYVSAATAGLVTETPPAASGNLVQRIGIAMTADIIYFNPSYNVFEIT